MLLAAPTHNNQKPLQKRILLRVLRGNIFLVLVIYLAKSFLDRKLIEIRLF